MNNKNFSYYVTKFFSDYLPNHKGCSSNTIFSYRDSFSLFLTYCNECTNLDIDNLSFFDINTTLILNYLSWLENSRKATVSTRNQRLAAWKSFCKYVQFEAPEFYEICSSIRNITSKKGSKKSLNYLSIEATKILMQQPKKNDKQELRDFVILSLLYDSAARVTEIINLKVSNVLVNEQNIIQLLGKGNKTRVVPISKEVSNSLRKYINVFELGKDDILFFNKQKQKLTKEGISYILNKYIIRAKKEHSELYSKKISPHSLRHSKAMHLLESNVNLIYIRDFLGHTSVATTEIYAKANPEIRRKQIENASEKIIKKSRYTKKEKNNLENFLKTLS